MLQALLGCSSELYQRPMCRTDVFFFFFSLLLHCIAFLLLFLFGFVKPSSHLLCYVLVSFCYRLFISHGPKRSGFLVCLVKPFFVLLRHTVRVSVDHVLPYDVVLVVFHVAFKRDEIRGVCACLLRSWNKENVLIFLYLHLGGLRFSSSTAPWGINSLGLSCKKQLVCPVMIHPSSNAGHKFLSKLFKTLLLFINAVPLE